MKGDQKTTSIRSSAARKGSGGLTNTTPNWFSPGIATHGLDQIIRPSRSKTCRLMVKERDTETGGRKGDRTCIPPRDRLTREAGRPSRQTSSECARFNSQRSELRFSNPLPLICRRCCPPRLPNRIPRILYFSTLSIALLDFPGRKRVP